jgi:hypothetical protein
MPTSSLSRCRIPGLLCSLVGMVPAAEVPPITADGFVLVWADGFDRAGTPDPASWVPETGFVRNRELQWYQLANAVSVDGILTIEARRERVANPAFQAGAQEWQKQRPHAEFISACITTRGKHQSASLRQRAQRW